MTNVVANMPNTTATAPCVKPMYIGPVCVDPPVLQAPMAGFTNYAFRQIVREFGGAGLQATEMINAKGFLFSSSTRDELPDRLWGVADEPRPLAVQIWDNDPDDLAAVGGHLAHQLGVTIVDINFGCPVRRITEKTHSGSYLLKEPERMGRIIERVVDACRPTPVTAKIRLGCTRDNINANEIAQVVEAAGAAALTVHGRTAQDYFKGSADWDRIAAIKSYLKTIPLIGNGDVDSAQRAIETLCRYDVDGIMIARAALGKPWLFAQIAAGLRGEPIPPDPTPTEQRWLLLHHFELIISRFGAHRGSILMRRYACCYAQRRPGAREFRTRISHVSSPAEFRDVVENYFPSE